MTRLWLSVNVKGEGICMQDRFRLFVNSKSGRWENGSAYTLCVKTYEFFRKLLEFYLKTCWIHLSSFLGRPLLVDSDDTGDTADAAADVEDLQGTIVIGVGYFASLIALLFHRCIWRNFLCGNITCEARVVRNSFAYHANLSKYISAEFTI